MRKLFALVAFVGMSWTGSALAAEALLIRHEVLTVPMGAEITLKPGFFIGQAWTADGFVADAALTPDHRAVTFKAKAPGRTVVTAYNLREPNKRVEFEVVVSDEETPVLTPSLLPSEPIPADVYSPMPYDPMNSTEASAEPENDSDAMAADTTSTETESDPLE